MSLHAIYKIALLPLLGLAALHPALAQQSSPPGGLQSKLESLFSGNQGDDLLEPDRAFTLRVSASGSNKLIAELAPAKGYYIYKHKVSFALKDAKGVKIKSINMPAGEMKTDQIYGKSEVYKQAVPIELTLERTGNVRAITLMASYQGCHEKAGVCYPPIEKTVNLTLP